MKRRVFLCQAGYCVAGVSATTMTGCGTVMHPERQGRRHSGRLDLMIVALDACGLLLWFVPGIVAFAVDFYTGAIYLPGGYYCSKDSNRLHEGMVEDLKLKRIQVPKEELDHERIEEVVSEHVGNSISLKEDNSRFSRLTSIDEFPVKYRLHLEDPQYGHSYALICDGATGMI
jgi:hypothetical protein